MFNLLIEKVAEHFILGRAATWLASFHAYIIGYRTDIAVAAWLATYALEYVGVIDHAHGQSARAYIIGGGLITGMDKLTRYAPLADNLIVKLQMLQKNGKEEKQ